MKKIIIILLMTSTLLFSKEYGIITNNISSIYSSKKFNEKVSELNLGQIFEIIESDNSAIFIKTANNSNKIIKGWINSEETTFTKDTDFYNIFYIHQKINKSDIKIKKFWNYFNNQRFAQIYEDKINPYTIRSFISNRHIGFSESDDSTQIGEIRYIPKDDLYIFSSSVIVNDLIPMNCSIKIIDDDIFELTIGSWRDSNTFINITSDKYEKLKNEYDRIELAKKNITDNDKELRLKSALEKSIPKLRENEKNLNLYKSLIGYWDFDEYNIKILQLNDDYTFNLKINFGQGFITTTGVIEIKENQISLIVINMDYPVRDEKIYNPYIFKILNTDNIQLISENYNGGYSLFKGDKLKKNVE